jgi:predicted phosphatase
MKESNKLFMDKLPHIARAISKVIDEIAGQHLKFTLVVYLDDRVVHASNCDLKPLSEVMKVIADHIDGEVKTAASHQVH